MSSHIQVRFIASKLQFRFPFRIAHGIRTYTDVVLVCAEWEGHRGYGEATLPPYLPDTVETVSAFLSSSLVQSLAWPCDPAHVFDTIDQSITKCMPGKAALDMALWELQQQITSAPHNTPAATSTCVPHTYTISIGTRDAMRDKLAFAHEYGFDFFKLKLDGIQDEQVVSDYQALCASPFAVDANQGWSDVNRAILFGRELERAGCVLIEQPFDKTDRIKSRGLRDQLDIPVIADEACQRLVDIDLLADSFSGINIKLQKCGGLTEARRMIGRARDLDMKVLMGCMSESSIGCGAAETLAPLCDWADLDGPWLISNDDEIRDLVKRL